MKKVACSRYLPVCLYVPRLVFAVDFDILSYKGDLNIHANGGFQETITLPKDDFNEPIDWLGKAGKIPSGFEISTRRTNCLSIKNGQIVQDISPY